MKRRKWALIIVTFAIIIWLLFNLEIWAREWKDLFFYQVVQGHKILWYL